jgi:hypothetical protein
VSRTLKLTAADRRVQHPPSQATAGLGKQRARRLIVAARAEGPRETLLVLLLIELGLRISEAVVAAQASLQYEA